jgi:hypothetical protein
MRIGANPYRHADAYSPKEVTVALLVHIPELHGYYEQQFEILKLSLASLRKHTATEFDLLICDNGSCAEVRSYLRGLQDDGIVQFLLLSEHNLGNLGAISFILSAAPGRYVAYADADMFFFPGWLEEALKVVRTYPRVGMVSCLPTWHNFPVHTESTRAIAAEDPQIHSSVERNTWPREWADEYAESTTRDPAAYAAECAEIDIRTLEREGVAAFATCTHCQFVVDKENLKHLLPFRSTGQAYAAIRQLDQTIDDAGLMRLSTVRPLVYHMGTSVSPRLKAYLEQYGIAAGSLRVAEPPRISPLTRRLLRSARVRRLLVWGYNKLHFGIAVSYGRT